MRRQSHSQRKVKYLSSGGGSRDIRSTPRILTWNERDGMKFVRNDICPDHSRPCQKYTYIYIYFASRLWSRSREQRRYEIHRESNFTGSQFHYVTRMAIRLERACRGTDYCYHRSSPGFYTRTQTSEIIIYFCNIT